MTAAALLEIDLDALADNWRRLDAAHDGATAGIIKADAYGLGANYVAPKLFAAGCRDFFVAHLSEALAVRPAIPTARLAVLNGLLPGQESEFLAHDIIPVLGSLAEIALWRAEAKQQGRALHCMTHRCSPACPSIMSSPTWSAPNGRMTPSTRCNPSDSRQRGRFSDRRKNTVLRIPPACFWVQTSVRIWPGRVRRSMALTPPRLKNRRCARWCA